jgi:hypothetical protein
VVVRGSLAVPHHATLAMVPRHAAAAAVVLLLLVVVDLG